MDADDISIHGGTGYDRVNANGGSAALTFNMEAAEVEFVSGSAFGDTLNGEGSSVSVKILGQNGNDTLTGGNANDFIYGGAGADTINGSFGDDFLSGGSGIDVFVFDQVGDNIVSDFNTNGETIDLSALGITYANLTISALGANHTLIEWTDLTIALLNVQVSTISASDFDFV